MDLAGGNLKRTWWIQLALVSAEGGGLRVDTVMETKLDFKLVQATGHCSTVHGKFLIVLDFLATTTITDTFASKETLNL